ncbi:MAG: diguanylate cyclase [Coleofasciculus sp. G3-WIS-01]|uniref:diguanylate cyclase n=1 Tax=Coleofasciculus sp. G3-WIS-01 TaxID=3069528 RepID=UPI0032FF11F3
MTTLTSAIDRYPLTVTPDTCLCDVIALLNQGTHSCPFPSGTELLGSSHSDGTDGSCVLVIEGEQLVGVITSQDLVQIIVSGSPLESLHVAEVMTRQVITLKQSELSDGWRILNLFEYHGIRHLPVVNDEHQLVGVVTPESLHHVLPCTELLKRRRVPDVITPEFIHVSPTNSVLTIAQRMAEYRVNYVVIAEQQKNRISERIDSLNSADSKPFLFPIGIITEQDIVQFKALALDLSLPAHTLMSFPLLCVSPEESLWKAYQKMQQWRVQQLGVCSHQGELLGMVTQTSILQNLDPAHLYRVIQDLQQHLSQQGQIIASLQAENRQLQKNSDGEDGGKFSNIRVTNNSSSETHPYRRAMAGLIPQNAEDKIENSWDKVIPMELRECQQGQGILQNLNRILKTLSESHRILVSATQESELFQKICRLIVEVGGYQGAWVDLITDDMSQRVQLRAGFEASKKKEGKEEKISIKEQFGKVEGYDHGLAGHSNRSQKTSDIKHQTQGSELNNYDKNPYLKQLIIPGVNQSSGESPIDRVLQTGQPIVCRHIQTDPKFTPWRSHGLQQGDETLIILPLQVKDQPLGVLTIYAVNSGAFAPEEVQLLKELANDLASGIEALHIRLAREQAEAELCQLNQQLESRVQQRTAQLQQVRAQEELRQSEERFRTVANFTYDWEYWLNPEAQFIYVSPSCERITGYCADEFLQNASLLESIIHAEDREKFAQHRCATAVNQRVSGIDFRILTKTGELRWISHICQSVQSAEGDWLGIRASNRDITERKQAEEGLRESEKRFRSMFDQVAVGIVQATLSGEFLWVNQKFINLVQYSAEELQNKTCKDITHADDVDQELSCLDQLLAGEIDTFSREKRYMRKDGSEVWVNLSGSLIRDSKGEPKSYIGVVQDISDRKQAQAALQRLNEQLKGRVNELGIRNREMVLLGELSDFLQACLTVDEAYHAIATLVAPLFPESSGGVFVINPSENWAEAMATWGTALASQTLFSPKACWALRRGRPHWVNQSQSGLRCPHIHSDISPLESFCVPMMAQGKALGILYISSQQPGQLTEAKQRLALTVAEHLALSLANLKLRETLSQQSIRDALTGLFNRRYMEESLEREIHRAQRHQRPMGIIMLDIDHFKYFNDTFGHEAGDIVLRELGIFLQRNVRASDIACRYGGEELILILPDASLADTKQRAEQIRQDVKDLQIEYHHQLLDAIAISVGVAAFAEHGSTAEELIAAADRALYQAKAQGRDRVVVASS